MTRVLVLLLLFAAPSLAQDSILARARRVQEVPQKYLTQVSQKSRQFEQQINKRTAKALDRLLKQEKRMQQKLAKIDSIAAKNIFTRSIDSLGRFKAALKSKTAKLEKLAGGQYFGYLDTLQHSLGFLKESKEWLGKAKGMQDKLGNSLKSVNELKAKLAQAEQLKQYIRERRQLLKTQLSQYTSLTKDLQKINKEAYYYAQQINEYKAVFKDAKKAEAKAMELLQKVPAYRDFLQRNSQLASLFNLRASSGENLEQSLAGLQTRAQVEQLIQQRIGSGGPNARQAISQQMEAARSQFEELKKNFPDLDNAADMPDFKPKELKTKSFLQRLEFGTNVQFQRSNQYFPTTGDFAGQVGYKFSKNGIVGVGAAYKLGMGTGFDNIRFSHQGIGFRSFGDYKLKGTFFVNGGFEYNYNAAFTTSIPLLHDTGWTRSALLGISKKYKINNKLKGNLILLYDFLANQQIPKTDPIKFRVGYNF